MHMCIGVIAYTRGMTFYFAVWQKIKSTKENDRWKPEAEVRRILLPVYKYNVHASFCNTWLVSDHTYYWITLLQNGSFGWGFLLQYTT